MANQRWRIDLPAYPAPGAKGGKKNRRDVNQLKRTRISAKDLTKPTEKKPFKKLEVADEEVTYDSLFNQWSRMELIL